MKKFYMFAVLFLGLAVGVQAQDYGLGIKGGLNFSSFSGSDADDLDFEGRTGYHLGLLVEIPLGAGFGLQPEVLYSTLGAKTNQLVLDEAIDANFRVDYISVPVILKYYLAGGFNLQAGPQFSWNTKSDIEGDFNRNDVEEDFNAITDETKSFDVGGAVGLGYDLPFGLFAEARYIFGLSKIYETSDIKNRLIQVSVGIQI